VELAKGTNGYRKKPKQRQREKEHNEMESGHIPLEHV